MKRTLLILSGLLLALLCFAPLQTLAEEEGVLISVATTSGEMGEEVDVAVTLQNCFHVVSSEFDINYDPAALSVVSVTPGDIFPAQYCVTYTGNPGRIGVACASALGFTGDGVILTIRFKIIADSGSPLTITTHIPSTSEYADQEITWIDEDYESYPAFVTIENGGVTVAEAPLPTPAVTPWVPATPIPTPSPTPELTATPKAAQPLQTLAQTQGQSPSPEAAPSISSLNPAVYYVGGGLLLALIALVIVLIARRKNP